MKKLVQLVVGTLLISSTAWAAEVPVPKRSTSATGTEHLVRLNAIHKRSAPTGTIKPVLRSRTETEALSRVRLPKMNATGSVAMPHA